MSNKIWILGKDIEFSNYLQYWLQDKMQYESQVFETLDQLYLQLNEQEDKPSVILLNNEKDDIQLDKLSDCPIVYYSHDDEQERRNIPACSPISEEAISQVISLLL